MELALEPLTSADLGRFAEMVVGLYTDDPSETPMDLARAEAQAAAMLAGRAKAHPLLARRAGALEGYAIVVPFYSNELGGEVAVLDELYVRPEARGRGTGTALLDALRAWAKARGYTHLELEVNDANPRARRLYERAGMKAYARRRMTVRL